MMLLMHFAMDTPEVPGDGLKWKLFRIVEMARVRG